MITLDIFCDVIDNYGDAGVCLHLSRNLSKHDYKVRLFCNNLNVLNTIINEQDLSNNNLEIINWEQSLKNYQAPRVVISAFNCRFDEITNQALKQAQLENRTIIINLEYLSAEDWVESCHGLTSYVDGLCIYYFFPGFTSKTGGLNVDQLFKQKCKSTLLAIKNNIQESVNNSEAHKRRTLSLFGYKNPIIKDLLTACEHSSYQNEILVFEGLALDNLQQLTNLSLQVNTTVNINDQLKIKVSPMVSHQQYDEFLLNSDFNLVRGEDSIVRAMHTGHPFLWHIYPQNEDAHLVKLQSFLTRMEHISLKEIPILIEQHKLNNEDHPYLQIDSYRAQRACKVISEIMMSYNSKEHFEQNFDLDEFAIECAPIYYNFACYLCAQTDLTDSLNKFIHDKI